MHPSWAAHPAADSCLSKPYSSRQNQKGGTIIDETVADLAVHQLRILTPDASRPASCRCGCGRLHVHGRRERHPTRLFYEGHPVLVVTILVFICVACRATWRVIPGFLARCLWHPWEVVEREMLGKPRVPEVPRVPARTAARWRSRLAQAAHLPVQVLVVAGGALRDLAAGVGPGCSRGEFLGCGESFSTLAALLHRLAPGVRLM